MPVEFLQQEPSGGSSHATCLVMMYDGSGRRISKTLLTRASDSQGWDTTLVTHYTGIGTEIRENYAGPTKQTKVVVNMPVFFRVTLTRLKPRSYIEKDILRLSNGGAILPKRSFGASRQGLGRYGIENADGMAKGDEFYLKNHLGSTMMVAQVSSTNASEPAKVAAAYDYRAFGEQVTLTESADKVTENFTGKERDDETELDYFGARYLDPMLGMWISVDPARQYLNLYLYAANNPINRIDPNGLEDVYFLRGSGYQKKPEPHINYPYDVWREQLRPAIETIKNKGYSVYIGPADSKSFARLVADPEAQRAFYMGHIRGNSASGKPDALSTYFHKAVEASQFGDYSNLSVELYLFGCNSKSLENSEWNSVFPNIIGNSDDVIESNTNAEQFFKSVEDYANNLPQKEILLEE